MSDGRATIIAAGLTALGVLWVAYAKQRHELRVRHIERASEQLVRAFEDFTNLYDAFAAVAASRTFADNDQVFEQQLEAYRKAHTKAMSSTFFFPPELDPDIDRMRLEIPTALAKVMAAKRLTNADCVQLLVQPFAALMAFRDAAVRWRRASWLVTFGELKMEPVDFQFEPQKLDQRWLDAAKKQLARTMVTTPVE